MYIQSNTESVLLKIWAWHTHQQNCHDICYGLTVVSRYQHPTGTLQETQQKSQKWQIQAKITQYARKFRVENNNNKKCSSQRKNIFLKPNRSFSKEKKNILLFQKFSIYFICGFILRQNGDVTHFHGTVETCPCVL